MGNNRILFDQYPVGTPRVIQEDEYYAFGLRSAVTVPSQPVNRNLYNGKEIQTDLVNQYDYGARFYDPVIARFTTIDPLADDFERFSPYNYVLNNPVLLIDPDGMSADSGKAPTPKPLPTVHLKEVKVVGRRTSKSKQASDFVIPYSPPAGGGAIPVPVALNPVLVFLGLLVLPANHFDKHTDYLHHHLISAKTLKDILDGATAGQKTKGRTTNWEKDGGQEGADEDFDSLNPSDVKPIPGGRTGIARWN